MPSTVEQIDFDNIKDLTIKNDELYWKGNRLKTQTVQHFAFTFWQWFTGAVIAVGAIAAPMVTYVAELEKICNVTRHSFPLCGTYDMKNRFPPPTKPASAPASRTG